MAVSIPEDELEESFVRASGPGGQNVNKVSSAVQLRFDVVNSPSLTEPVKQRLININPTCVRSCDQQPKRTDVTHTLQKAW